MPSSILVCAEVTGHYKGRMRKEGGGMVAKAYKKWEGDVGPCESHMSLLTGAYKVRLLPSHTGWETGALSSGVGWNKQQIHLAALIVLRQPL